jgi:hypothetical protein
MSAEENKALVRRIYQELWQKGNMDAIDKYYLTSSTMVPLPTCRRAARVSKCTPV